MRPDYQIAKNWGSDHKSSINLYQPTFNGNSLGVANIRGGTVIIGSKDSDLISPVGVKEVNSPAKCFLPFFHWYEILLVIKYFVI